MTKVENKTTGDEYELDGTTPVVVGMMGDDLYIKTSNENNKGTATLIFKIDDSLEEDSE